MAGRLILVPLDDEARGGRAVPTARSLAALLGGTVRLVSVVGDEAERAAREELLGAVGDAEGIDAVTVVVDEDPAAGIVREAGADGIVCMATAASLLPHAGHVGSIAERVVRAIERPVVLVGPEAAPGVAASPGRIVIPVDGSPLSEAALGPAAALADAMALPLWVVTVISPKDQAQAAGALGGSPAGESGYVAALARAIARDRGVRAEFEVLHIDDPADAILDFAAPDGIVVMTTHGRTGLSRLFAGSVTTSVVARSRHPVLVLSPGRNVAQG